MVGMLLSKRNIKSNKGIEYELLNASLQFLYDVEPYV